ncbi:MAG: hypothetical protein L6408_04780 [Nanoarchaeota archaeon]|nr:hypothetical protein [Nanoarchaeota archaeon]
MIGLLQYDIFWTAVIAIFTAMASIGIYLVHRQLCFESWVKVQDLFTDEKFTSARTKVSSCLQNPDKVCSRDDAYIVCRKMDELAHLAPFLGIFGKRKVLRFWGVPIAKAWYLLKPFVEQERKELTGWDTKWQAFEDLGERAIKGKPNLKGPTAKISDGST